MNNLEKILKLLYKNVSVKSVIDGKLNPMRFDDNMFVQMASAYIHNYSENEMQNMWSYYIGLFQDNARQNGRKQNAQMSVFEPLFYYAGDCLTIQNNHIVCRYDKLEYWRHMTLELGEDLAVAAYLAQSGMDEHTVNQRGFSWKRIIGHNNMQLNQILSRGVSENHFHLGGSAPIFHISWLSLMNNVNSAPIKKNILKYDASRRYTNKAYISEYQEESLYRRYLQAALIRVLLFSKLAGERITLGQYFISSDVAVRLLKLPPLMIGNQEVKLSCADIREVINPAENVTKIEYSIRNLFMSVLKKNALFIKADEEAKKSFWVDCSWNILLESRIGGYHIQTKRLSNILRKCAAKTEFTAKAFLELLFSTLDEISLADIPVNYVEDFAAYNSLWERKTRENVVQLLLNPDEMERHVQEIQGTIDSFRYPVGKAQPNKMMETDYLLWHLNVTEDMTEKTFFVFFGERWLLYTMLRRIYDHEESCADYYALFYAYILIKESIRAELVQSNDNVGFRNFQIYERRKAELFQDMIYKNTATRLTLRECLLDEHIRTIELRIRPKETAVQLRKQISMLDDVIDREESFRHQYFYTLHFIKSMEKDIWLYGDKVRCRNALKRDELKKQVKAIEQVRERFPKVGKRILGIDAASNEIGCRPEVFGRTFRYLKKMTTVYYDVEGRQELPQIRATYHVGEDFLDLVDGLRAIDEAIKFLHLDCGDRLGHALALGVEVEDWYKNKGYRVMLPQQDYLDNLVWLHQKLCYYNIEGFDSLKSRLEDEFAKYFDRIYGNYMEENEIHYMTDQMHKYYKKGFSRKPILEFGIYEYYTSMLLRGDEPQFYDRGYYDELAYLHTGVKEAINTALKDESRYMPESAILYFYYHFSKKVRDEGNRTIQVQISRDYVRAAAMVQKTMQKEIGRRGIAVETNPTSNSMIGTFRNYENHPILTFHNHELTNNMEKESECPQLIVSINTDDQGVFSTSLENEYALLAHSLEKIQDEDGEYVYKKALIYKWLDEIRIMGNEQSFGAEQYREHMESLK